jgi:elongation factor G
VLAGIGELHLEVILQRLHEEFKVEASLGPVHVVYKEAFTVEADGEGRYVKQVGGRGQYALTKVRLFPRARGSGYVFENGIGSLIPAAFVTAIDEGVKDALMHGVLAGYPIDDVRIRLYDGSYHETDSSPAAFRIAGSMAFRDAAKKAGPVVLEPVMLVQVTFPAQYAAEVARDLESRRGDLLSESEREGIHVLRARAPMARMFGYASGLRDLTLGRGSYTVQFDRYEPQRR